jgi:hypothetical protein
VFGGPVVVADRIAVLGAAVRVPVVVLAALLVFVVLAALLVFVVLVVVLVLAVVLAVLIVPRRGTGSAAKASGSAGTAGLRTPGLTSS